MIIRGLQKLTLLDFPGKISATVFLGGCNFRCPFCHNSSLVLGGGDGTISEDELFSFLEKRRGVLGGVCISGGEPTLSPELPEFIEKIRALGYAVKLDTNGYSPRTLSELLSRGLIDYVAMDIKNSFPKYAQTAGLADLDIEKIKESIELLIGGSVPYEFRTTVVRELHTPEDIRDIAIAISGAERYYLQSFIDSGDILSEGLSSPTEEMLHLSLEAASEYVKFVAVRGV